MDDSVLVRVSLTGTCTCQSGTEKQRAVNKESEVERERGSPHSTRGMVMLQSLVLHFPTPSGLLTGVHICSACFSGCRGQNANRGPVAPRSLYQATWTNAPCSGPVRALLEMLSYQVRQKCWSTQARPGRHVCVVTPTVPVACPQFAVSSSRKACRSPRQFP